MNRHSPLSLLFLNPTGVQVWGGVEGWMYTVALGLRNRGYAVQAAGRPNGRFIETMADAGVDTLDIGGRNDLSPRDIWRIRRFIRRHGVDVVVTKLNRGIRLAGISAFLSGGRRAVMAHMGLMEAKPGLMSTLTYRFLMTGVNVPCQAIADRLMLDRGFAPDRVHVVPYGIDTLRFHPDDSEREAVREEFGIGEQPLIGIVARLDDQKEHTDFLDVLDRLDGVHALIVGTGALEKSLKDKVERLGLEDRAHFLGHRDDVHRLLHGMDVLVLSSRDEGLPFVVLEAMAVGLPIVATRVGGLGEVVREGTTGFLVQAGDPEALAASIHKVLFSPDCGGRLGREGRALVLSKFHLEGMVDGVESVLQSLVQRRRGVNGNP